MIRLSRRYRLAAVTLVPAFFALWLYWPSLSLPIMYDDLLHIRISGGLTPATVWLPTEAFGFYRPLTFLPLILIKQLFGYYPAQLLHGMNVAQHGLNVLLLVVLVRRLWQNDLLALVTGLLFALFPFSYQAVAVYGHNVHPATTGLILLGLLTYLNGVQAGSTSEPDPRLLNGQARPVWWWLTGVIFLLSLLSHESAILFGVFAALVHWTVEDSFPSLTGAYFRQMLRRPPPWLVFIGLGAGYAIIYQFLPISRGPQVTAVSGASLWPKVLYLLQAAAYPLTWFAHHMTDLSATWLILGSLAIMMALTALSARLRENILPLLLGWGWWGMAGLLIALPLPADYLLHGPRLLYLSAVGLALLWGRLLAAPKAKSWQKGVLLGLACFTLVMNWQFVRGRLRQYDQLTQPIDEIAGVMQARAPGEGFVVANLPQWLAPLRNTYAVGSELTAMLGNYLFADEIMAQNVGGDHPVTAVVVPALLESPVYAYGIHDESLFRSDAATTPVLSDWDGSGSQVFVVRYSDEGPKALHAGAFEAAGANGPPLATFKFYELAEADAPFCDGEVRPDLVWKRLGADPLPPTVSIFVQMLAEDGQLIAQADGPPLGLPAEVVQLEPGWQIRDLRVLAADEAERPWLLLVGVYDYVTGERFPARDSLGALLPDNAFRLPVTDCP